MAKQAKKSNLLRNLIIFVIGLITILIVLKLSGVIGKPSEIEVEVSKASRKTILEKVSASGTVQPVIEVKIAPEVSGEIIDLLIEEGDSVGKGVSLVKIRPDIAESQLERANALLAQQQANIEQSKAALARAQATFIRAEQDYIRNEKLWKEKVISEADWQLASQNFEVAKNDVASAKQNVEAAKASSRSTEASYKEAQENFRRTTVVAPMSGIVSKLSVKKGERVVGTASMAGTEMLRIADLNKMEVRVNVNENDIVRVHLGDTAIIDVDSYSAQEKKFKGIVTLIANTAKDKVSTDAITEFEVRILILRSSYLDLVKAGNKFPFRPGMTASVDILTRRKDNVLAVPLAAVVTRDDDSKSKPAQGPQDNATNTSTADKQKSKEKEKTVIFVNDNGVAKMVEVKTGISDYDNIEILSGVSDSTQVITGPFLAVTKRLKDGEKIRVMPVKKPEDGTKK